MVFLTGVVMKRSITQDLIVWKSQSNRKPLLIRGARQVGKSYVVEQFGKDHFENMVVLNFEFTPAFIQCFNSLDPVKIIKSIELISGEKITVGKTLLFLDEIQLCPAAILSLRYFKEKLGELHVIGAGSFLEFVINDHQYQEPVGRVQSLYLKPCSFREFLIAVGEERFLDYLSNLTLQESIEIPVHEHLLERCREYFILGGMPEVIHHYVTQNTFYGCEKIQATILEYYRRDFSKYGAKINTAMLQKIFSRSPGLLAKHFKYVDIAPDVPPRDQKPALEALVKAGILYKVAATHAQGLPLQTGLSEKKFKLLFLDLGLAKQAMGLDIDTLIHQELILMNQGALSEQFVGQELLAYAPNFQESALFYWERDKRGSQAEVDFVIHVGPTIYPIEVKSGKTGRLKSLQVFLEEKNLKTGIRISSQPFIFEKNILSIPFYMIHEIPRLLKNEIRHSAR